MMAKRARRIVTAISILAVVFFASTVSSSQTHWTTGTELGHDSSSHPNNLSHIRVWVGADHSGTISSGGQLHDRCLGGPPCLSGAGGDFAIDIGAGGGGQDSYLTLLWGGSSVDPYTTNPIDFSQNVTMKASVDRQQNFRTTFGDSAHRACDYQRYKVLVTYTDTSGVPHPDQVIGWVYIAHLNNWQYGLNATLNANKFSTFEAGGILGEIDLKVGTISTTVDYDCSWGAHSHVELLHSHGWGEQFEWHSGPAGAQGPEAYYENGQNGVHWHKDHQDPPNYMATAPYPDGSGDYDSVTRGQLLMCLGGSATSYWLTNNPFNLDH